MTAPDTPQAITLTELGQRLTRLVAHPAVQDVWVTAELSDVRVRGHCYMELLQKDEQGRTVAKMRAAIWQSTYRQIAPYFKAHTGRDFGSGLNVMVQGSATYHPLYGMAFNITAVDPSFTMGDIERRRMEILMRLKADGILDDNRNLEWSLTPVRVAIISAPGAAGYGDFINQLMLNSRRLRFAPHLFPAVMQGVQAPPTIISALEQIAAEADMWDCVVIIRGGGASSDLEAFDNYDLAAGIAQFPLPVIIGLGHERDVTVLDYVANMRVKTPTAAAEWLVERVGSALDMAVDRASAIHRCVAERLSLEQRRLAYAESMLPVAPQSAIDRSRRRLAEAAAVLSGISPARISPEQTRLGAISAHIEAAARSAIQRRAQHLDAQSRMLEALSPSATLARGYSITRVNGHAISTVAEAAPGTVIETELAGGSFESTRI